MSRRPTNKGAVVSAPVAAVAGDTFITATADESLLAGDAVMIFRNSDDEVGARKLLGGPKFTSLAGNVHDLGTYDPNFFYAQNEQGSGFESMTGDLVVYAIQGSGGGPTNKGRFDLQAARISDKDGRPLAMGPKRSIGPSGGSLIVRVLVKSISSTTFLVVQFGTKTSAVVATLDRDTLEITLGTYNEQAVAYAAGTALANATNHPTILHMASSNSKYAIVMYSSDGNIYVDTITLSGATITWEDTTSLGAGDGIYSVVRHADNIMLMRYNYTTGPIKSVGYSNDADMTPAALDSKASTFSGQAAMVRVTAAGRFCLISTTDLEYFDVDSAGIITLGTKTTGITVGSTWGAAINVSDNVIVLASLRGQGFVNIIQTVVYTGDTPASVDVRYLLPMNIGSTGSNFTTATAFGSGFLFTFLPIAVGGTASLAYVEVDGSGNIAQEDGLLQETGVWTPIANETLQDCDVQGEYGVIAANTSGSGTVYLRAFNTRTGAKGATKIVTGWNDADVAVALFPSGLKGCVASRAAASDYLRLYVFDVNPSTLEIIVDTDYTTTTNQVSSSRTYRMLADDSGADQWFYVIAADYYDHQIHTSTFRKDDAGVWTWYFLLSSPYALPESLAFERNKNLVNLRNGAVMFSSPTANTMNYATMGESVSYGAPNATSSAIASPGYYGMTFGESIGKLAVGWWSNEVPSRGIVGVINSVNASNLALRQPNTVREWATIQGNSLVSPGHQSRGQHITPWGAVCGHNAPGFYVLYPTNWDTGAAYEGIPYSAITSRIGVKGHDLNLSRTFIICANYAFHIAFAIEWNPPEAMTGVVSADVAKAGEASVITQGAITGLTGLEAGKTYYMDRTGHRTTSPTPYYLYVATSATTAVR